MELQYFYIDEHIITAIIYGAVFYIVFRFMMSDNNKKKKGE
jgi:phosphotransferase system  glucose/maltose/N-acetylglucosamine-specific IIC component